jgi:RNA polymerase sigma factor (TIGR02999 family)
MANEFPITQRLLDWRMGHPEALEEVMPQIYDSLHKIAQRYMRRENPGHTLQPTAIVNEAYIKLINANVDWQNRAHFFAIAARLMRRILVDHAKAKHRDKRGGSTPMICIDDVSVKQPEQAVDLVELDLALKRLAELDERKSKIVELHYFGGLKYDETAAVLQISAATVDRELRLAKAWLHKAMNEAS